LQEGKDLAQQQAAKKERHVWAVKEKTVGTMRKVEKSLAGTTISKPIPSKRQTKAAAKKQEEKLKEKKVEAAAQQLGEELGGVAVGKDEEDL
jgi:hypothetical protein